jgi:hypothetical protein
MVEYDELRGSTVSFTVNLGCNFTWSWTMHIHSFFFIDQPPKVLRKYTFSASNWTFAFLEIIFDSIHTKKYILQWTNIEVNIPPYVRHIITKNYTTSMRQNKGGYSHIVGLTSNKDKVRQDQWRIFFKAASDINPQI